jgi:hypothetical protein
MARRRGRFARGTSGSQNLTTLIYSILKEQQATKKTAILNAFDANMGSRSYTATFGGETVTRAVVEAYYADLMNAYPEGSVERDNLRAELIDFHNKAINKEINAYSQAYKEGTNAFGQKIELNEYLSYLRDAKSATTNEDDQNKYNLEEFLVTFNDVHDDLKAKSAGAGSLASFYKRELTRAEEMGITKDSDSYRTVEQYLASAAKASAAEGRQQAAQDAADTVSGRMLTAGTAIVASLQAAVAAGRINAQDMVAIIGDGSGNGIVARFSNLDLSTKQRILLEGERSGVQMNGEAFTAETFISHIDDTRTFLKTLIASGSVDGTSKATYRSMLGAFDAEISGPVGLMTDLEAATDSALDLVIDNEKGLGNPMINVEAYKNHSSVIAGSGASAVAGQAMLDILNGKIPNPEDFGGRTELWELTEEEQGRLAETYTGNAYIATGGMQDPATFITMVIDDYTDAHNVTTGAAFVTAGIDENGSASVSITDEPATGGTPFVYSVKLSNGTVVPVVGRQKLQQVLGSDGSQFGQVIFDIDKYGRPQKSFITMDGYKMDYDAFVRWTDTNGVGLATDSNGNVQANTGNIDSQGSQIFMGTFIKNDPSFGVYVSDEPWNRVAYGSEPSAALKILGSRVGDDLLPGQSKMFKIGSDGNITVTDPEAVYKRYNMTASDFEAVINANDPGSSYNSAKTAIQDRLFRISERESLVVKPGEKDPVLIGLEAASEQEGKRLRAQNAARLLAERQAAGLEGFDAITAFQALLGIGAGQGPVELARNSYDENRRRLNAERIMQEQAALGNTELDPITAIQILLGIGADKGGPRVTAPTAPVVPTVPTVPTEPKEFNTSYVDPVSNFFLRNINIFNPEATKISGPASIDQTKIGKAPVISSADFRSGVKITPTSVIPIRTNLNEKPRAL